MEELLNRLDKVERAIPSIKNKVARRDLMKMLRNTDKLLVQADMERVECRRLHRETIRYQELIKKADQSISHLEQHLTFAALLNG